MTTVAKEFDAEAAVGLFSGVCEGSLSHLYRSSPIEIVPDDTIIISEGVRLRHLHIVRRGVIELFAQAGESRTTISLLGPGESFILAAVVNNAVALMSARTLGGTELMHIPANLFRKLLKSDQQLLRNVACSLAGNFRGVVRHLRDQKLRSTNQRLAAYLVRLHQQQGARGVVRLPLRKNLIASLLGMQPSSLSRAFADLQVLGVTVEQDRVNLAKLEELETFACLHQRVDATDATPVNRYRKVDGSPERLEKKGIRDHEI
ncbi:MAG: hypothetical protein APF80_13795 [Alphaproteobacteria bacterium BRH_c36]|nr:MAG: hypothetical protein APF80_13795 [Alphaproteobacteria bacterium BRH_c36]